MLLSDFGADIIKVERLEGDDTRQWGPPFLDEESLWYLSVNRNKRSLSLDYACKEGRAVLEALLDKADVVVTNQLGARQVKLGIDAETVRAGREHIIHVSLTGFGLSGPNAAMPCYDLIAEGYSGVMDLTGAVDSAPQKVGAPAADKLAGSDAALATLAALHHRAKTGLGCAIDIALTESMIRFMSPRIVPYLGSGEIPRRSGGTDSVIAIYQTFDTLDLPMTLALGNDAIWQRFWDAIGDPDYGEAPHNATNADRRANRAAIVRHIAPILKTKPRGEWLKLFARNGIPAGPIYRVDEVVEDPHFRDRSLFYHIEREGVSLPQVGLGIHVDGVAAGYFSPPPRLGEHNEEILTSVLGYDQDRISRLRAAGAIGGAAAICEEEI
jgi:crotonobetainyl-CoA:carnitine CoA-transferase CaiB-like acyl-CoA transferase